ncbi:MAG: hypothetical protein LUG12_03685 [Erysipelotrichaceae bacterium]|nr:hypothetical protein [Erysipelotrichaceae bacterium]
MKSRLRDSIFFKFFIIVLICFVIDSTISFFMPYNYTKTGIFIVPCIGLMMFALLVNTIKGEESYLFAALCGLYYSVVYSNSLAIYILVYLIITFSRTFFKLEKLTIIEAVLYCGSTVLLQEIMLYWIMWITNITRYPVMSFLIMRLLPTVCFNMILSIVVYWVYNKVKVEEE